MLKFQSTCILRLHSLDSDEVSAEAPSNLSDVIHIYGIKLHTDYEFYIYSAVVDYKVKETD